MRDISEDKGRVRRYLLGELSEAEQQQVEELFLTNPEYGENVLIIENELIEDYLEDALTEAELIGFEQHFLLTPQQIRKLRIAKSLKKYAANQADTRHPPADEETSLPRNGQRRTTSWLNWRRPLVVLPIAAALLLVLTLGTVKLLEMRRLSHQREQQLSRRIAAERELAKLNDPATPRDGLAFSVALSPVLVRDAQRAGKVSPPANAPVVELLLLLVGERYPSYRVLLLRTGETEPLTIQNLHAGNTPKGQAVIVKIPSHLLQHGDYQLQLLGVMANGETELVSNYDFQV